MVKNIGINIDYFDHYGVFWKKNFIWKNKSPDGRILAL